MPSTSSWPQSWLRAIKQPSTIYAPLKQDELPLVDQPTLGSEARTEKAHPPSRRRRWLVIAVVVLFLGAIFFVLSGPAPAKTTSNTGTNTEGESIENGMENEGLEPPVDFHHSGPPPAKDPVLDNPPSQPTNEAAAQPTLETPHAQPTLITPPADNPAESSPEIPAEAPVDTSPVPDEQHQDIQTAPQRKLHLLLPATSSNPHLCRTVFSAVTMQYPEPVLINWGAKPNPGESGVSHLMKVIGLKNYLASLGAEASNDLVVISDAYDLWFNLPSSVFINRYEKILQAENQRIESLWGRGALENGIRASTVFAADKGCAGYFSNEHWCWLQPESTQPNDTYRNKTDVDWAGYDKWSTFRPRYLNSGVIIGPVADLLAIFQRTEDYMKGLKLDKLSFWQSDQRIMIRVYASQQLWRTRKALENPQWRENNTVPPTNHTSPFANPDYTPNLNIHNITNIKYMDLKFQPEETNTGYEHGITIDFKSELSHTTGAADHEWAYLHYNDKPMLVPNRTDPRDCHVRVRDSLPEDLVSLPVPYAEVLGNQSTSSWGDLALYTNLCTGEIPAIIHHNGDKGQREKQWPTVWYAWHGLDILAAARARAAANPEMDIGVGGAKTDKGEHLTWDQMCHADTRKIFVDELNQYMPGATTWGVPPQFFD